MFAYCNNNPVSYSDVCGTNPFPAIFIPYIIAAAAEIVKIFLVVSVFALFLHPSSIEILADSLSAAYSQVKSEVYEYAETLKDPEAGKYANHQPRVHHIVPIGSFSNRSHEVQAMIKEMQQILTDVGINVANDPINQVVISQGFHAHIHTDEYFEMLHKELTAVKGDQRGVRRILRNYKAMLTWDDMYRDQMRGR